MKNNWQLLYNPFTRVAGWKAFFIGLPIVCLTVVLGWLTDTPAFGLEIKSPVDLSLGQSFAYTGIGLACYVGIMYIVGLIFSKGVRFQDILGTITLARAPYLLSPLLGLMTLGSTDGISEAIATGKLSVINWSAFIGITVLAIAVSVWAVAMLYYAFRISTDLKGPKCTWLFIASLLISEITMLIIL